MTVYWHTLTKEEVLETLQTSVSGLTQKEAGQRLAIYGYNKIVEEKQRSPASILAKQTQPRYTQLCMI